MHYVSVAEAQVSIPLEAPEMPQIAVLEPQMTCVTYTRRFFPNLPKGNARALEINLDSPIAGAVVKLKYGERIEDYHLDIILEVREETLMVKGWGIDGDFETVREIPRDETVMGYWLNPDML